MVVKVIIDSRESTPVRIMPNGLVEEAVSNVERYVLVRVPDVLDDLVIDVFTHVRRIPIDHLEVEPEEALIENHDVAQISVFVHQPWFALGDREIVSMAPLLKELAVQRKAVL